MLALMSTGCAPSSSPANCGGLIEATWNPPDVGEHVISSPANCGGLIEAGGGTNEAAQDGLSSPANCGGLIEAFSAHHTGSSRVGIFPRELRGPH